MHYRNMRLSALEPASVSGGSMPFQPRNKFLFRAVSLLTMISSAIVTLGYNSRLVKIDIASGSNVIFDVRSGDRLRLPSTFLQFPSCVHILLLISLSCLSLSSLPRRLQASLILPKVLHPSPTGQGHRPGPPSPIPSLHHTYPATTATTTIVMLCPQSRE